MKMVYSVDLQNDYFSIQKLEEYLQKYYTRVGVAPGVIYASAPIYRQILTITMQNSFTVAPLSKEKKFIHYSSVYGVLPIIPELDNKENEIGFNVSEEFEREFEKIILGAT